CSGVETGVTGNVWKVMVEPGQMVAAGDTILILESMKMEMEVKAASAGRVREITVKPGRTVNAGQTVAILEDIV
ncbi:MAG: hypothetical protein JHC88_24190, partial [Niveispirillum sp.]|nr:hypothetical protein [Niveispirillum sp.]